MPGMIDAHHHLTQSFGKSLAYGEPSEIFRRIWVPLEASLDDEFVFMVSKLAALESLRGGFTTVCDAGTRAKGDIGAVAAATQEAGLRCVLGMICNDGGNDRRRKRAARHQGQATRFLREWSGAALVHPSLAISVPEAASATRCWPICRAVRRSRRDLPDPCQRAPRVGRTLGGRAGLRPLQCWRAWARSARRY